MITRGAGGEGMVPEEPRSSEKGRKEARIGLDAEFEVISRVNGSSIVKRRFIECMEKLGFTTHELRIRKDGIKVDLIAETDSGEIGISLKTSTRTSFHQLDRRRLEEWKELLDMPDDVFNILKESILRISSNRRATFIKEEDRPKIASFFSSHIDRILEEIFRRGENVQLLAIFDKRKRKIYISRMDEVLQELKRTMGVSFSKKGIVRLGPFITVQRKGGDGSRIKIPKTDWRHPGNQLQFKFSPLKFVEWAKGRIRYCELDL